jgi:hypothetical protein
MSCHAYEDAILDESLPPPADLDAHVAGCASCRALLEGHRSALALKGVTLPPRARASRPAVLVRLATVVSVLVVAVTTVTMQCRSEPSMPTDVSLDALQALTVEPTLDLAVDDETYQSFKQLPAWLAPGWAEPGDER